MPRYQVATCAAASGAGRWDFETPCVIELNPNAGNWDSPGRVVLVAASNPFVSGSDSYKEHKASALDLMRRACEGLNA